MTVHVKIRPPVYEARQYDPESPESTAAALTAWILSAGPSSEVAVVADAQGFSITTSTDVDGSATVTGVVGHWIVLGRNGYYPEAFTPDDLSATFEVVP